MLEVLQPFITEGKAGFHNKSCQLLSNSPLYSAFLKCPAPNLPYLAKSDRWSSKYFMEWFRHTRRNQSVQTSEKIWLSKKLETRNSSVFQPCQQLLVLAALHHLPLCSPWVGSLCPGTEEANCHAQSSESRGPEGFFAVWVTYFANLMQNWVKYFLVDARLSRMMGTFCLMWRITEVT